MNEATAPEMKCDCVFGADDGSFQPVIRLNIFAQDTHTHTHVQAHCSYTDKRTKMNRWLRDLVISKRAGFIMRPQDVVYANSA